MHRFLMACLVAGFAFTSSQAADWPTYRADAERSGYTAQELPGKLALHWMRKDRHAPMPAWPTSDRMPFDRAYQPVVAGGLLFFGSSADGKVYAVDAKTGEPRWHFFTNAPVRFAPVVWKERVYVASDDSYLYCLSAQDGKLQWKKRGGPDDRMILGNDRMISRWPARGGPVMRDGILYFAAGIWPSEGIYLYALDPDSGKVLWQNDDSGSIYMAQPHGGANAASGVAAQGYLVATKDQLFMPTGRAVPAAFERTGGKFQYFHLQANRAAGGTDVLATDEVVFNSGLAFKAQTGDTLATIKANAKGNVSLAKYKEKSLALSPDGVFCSVPGLLIAHEWEDGFKVDRKGEKVPHRAPAFSWSVSDIPGGSALIVAGKKIITGGDKQVTMVDSDSKEIAWSAEVDGAVYGLALADGRLYASTDQGTIYCFAADEPAKVATWKSETKKSPYGDNALAVKAAEEIIAKTAVKEGYCIDLGCGDGALAYELARRTNLHIYAIDSDAEKVALARKKLDDAGLYGVRVTVHQAKLDKTPYPQYFANLAVSWRAVSGGEPAVDTDELYRMQRPYGGLACIGKPGAMRKLQRGALEGAGTWTHQYADAANTTCSDDELVKGPLGMLWFRDSDFPMPQRHGRGPAPLFFKGYLIVEGMHGLRCTDAYNGRTLWEYPLKDILKAYDGDHLVGTAATNSNLCVSEEGVFVRVDNRCLRLDLATGKKLAEFTAPKLSEDRAAPWGYLACQDGILFGSVADDTHILRHAYRPEDMSGLLSESQMFFAMDAETGKLLWQYTPKDSIRHNAIALGNGKVYLIDRPQAEKDRKDGNTTETHPPGTLLALDAKTGKTAWKNDKDIDGTTLMLSPKHDVLLMSYQSTRFKLPSEEGGKLTALRASSGQQLWQNDKAKYSTRPLINDQTIYAQGGAWDLLTGEGRTFQLKRSYGCGQIAASKHLMLFRSATLGYYDLLQDKGSIDYGGIRPGCWINTIPAGGLVLAPDASSGCSCSYLNRAWMALQPMGEE